jgi:hypothetical protein
MTDPNVYDVGDRVRLSCQFRALNGAPADPSTVTVKHRAGAGPVTPLVYGTDGEVVRTGPGAYYVDIDVDAPGDWFYRFEGTGDVVAAAEGRFDVRETAFD